MLRDYQVRAIGQVREAWRAGKRAICLTLPTGAGKTVVGGEIVRSHLTKDPGNRVVWLAHRIELVAQTQSRLSDMIAPLTCGVIAAGQPQTPDAPCQVASVQTLVARIGDGALPPATLVVLDEAHHYVAEEWGAIAQHYRDAARIGLTATPERSDGTALGDLFDHLVVGSTVAELTSLGYLVPCEVLAPPRRLTDALAGDPVDRYMAHASGRRAFFFCRLVSEAEDLARRLRDKGVAAECVHADTDPDVRAEALMRFKSGQLTALTNVYIYTEGTDIPQAEVAVICRGFGHASTYLQCVGRILRPAPGKTSALVLDLTGVSHQFGPPAEEREFSLTGDPIRLALAKQREAAAAYHPTKMPEPTTPLTILDLRLDPVTERTAKRWTNGMAGHKQVRLAQLLQQASWRGYKRGWAVHRFVREFGHLPWEPAGV